MTNVETSMVRAGTLLMVWLTTAGAGGSMRSARVGAGRLVPDPDTTLSVTLRFALAELVDPGRQTTRPDGTVVIADQVARMEVSGDAVGEITVRFTERVDRSAGIACNAGVVESGRLRLVATGEALGTVMGVTQACVSGIADRAVLDRAHITLRSGCVLIELRGADEVIVDRSNTVTGTWTTCSSAPVGVAGPAGRTRAWRRGRPAR